MTQANRKSYMYLCVWGWDCCLYKSLPLVCYYAFSTVFDYMITWYFCIGNSFIQGTDGNVDIAHFMKSIQYLVLFSDAEYTGPNLFDCIFTIKPVLKEELLISSAMAFLSEICILSQTWKNADLSSPTGWVFQPPLTSLHIFMVMS